MTVDIWFPPHKCELILTHNPHTSSYMRLDEYLGGMECPPDFESEEHKRRAIEANDMWELHWYPNTPVGFNSAAAPTLDELISFVRKEYEEEAKGEKENGA